MSEQRLIDANALIRKFKTASPMAVDGRARQMVEDMPTIEPKKGNWVGIDDEPYDDWECDRCGEIVTDCGWDALPNFCPNCGCRMQEEKTMTAIETMKYLLDKAESETPEGHQLVGVDIPVDIIREIVSTSQQWIPCSERLPEEKDAGILKKLGTEKRSEYVLATVEVKGERMTVTACTYDGKWNWDMKYAFPDFKVVAWMPLPEPWEGMP